MTTTTTTPNTLDIIKHLEAQVAALQAQVAAAPARKITAKVSEKGAISIYGMGRWPVTLYKSQFDALFTDDNIAMLRTFRAANDALLATKD